MRENNVRGSGLKEALGNSLQEEEIMRLVRDDVSAKYRPPSAAWKDSEIKKKRKFDLKVKETFDQVKKSSKLNKYLFESLQVI